MVADVTAGRGVAGRGVAWTRICGAFRVGGFLGCSLMAWLAGMCIRGRAAGGSRGVGRAAMLRVTGSAVTKVDVLVSSMFTAPKVRAVNPASAAHAWVSVREGRMAFYRAQNGITRHFG